MTKPRLIHIGEKIERAPLVCHGCDKEYAPSFGALGEKCAERLRVSRLNRHRWKKTFFGGMLFIYMAIFMTIFASLIFLIFK